MAEEIDKATEARRKALRNGEEDPVIVAQRFLNIYRQRHIFSTERKEAFDKMLLELSPDIRGLFSSLPGGVMLQDYVDELAEKNGVAKAVHHDIPAGGLNPEAHQQAQILAAALAQTQAPVQQAAAPAAAVGKVSMDKDFAGELARVMGSLMQQQTAVQQQNLEKMAQDLGKTQMFIAKMLKEGKEEQLQEISSLCRVIAEGSSKNKEEQKQELGELCRAIIESQRLGKEEQRQELGELCKVIAQSQTALSASLSHINNAPSSAPAAVQASNDAATQKLIEVVLEGQKQLNSRLDKVEEISNLRANDNQQLIAAFEKSQAEIVKTLSSVKSENLPVSNGGNEEKLAQIIGESQEKLVQTLLAGNFQQNNMAQSTNNANNIQITAPDNSAQLLLLVDKIAALQASNEENLEKAITRAIEEQGRLYDKISRQQTKELAEILAESLKDVARPVVYTMPAAAAQAVRPQAVYPAHENFEPQAFSEDEPGHIPPQMDDDDGLHIDLSSISEPETELPVEEDFVPAEPAEMPEPVVEEPVAEVSSVSDEDDSIVGTEGPKKKKKRRKKKKKKTAEAETPSVPEESFETGEVSAQPEEPATSFDFEDIVADENMSFSDLPEPKEIDIPADEVPAIAEPFETEDKAFLETDEPPVKLDESILQGFDDIMSAPAPASSDDWGFGSSPEEPEEAPVGNNDNEEGEDWEWAYVEDTGDDEENGVDVIGGNSYIYSSDLYSQEKAESGENIIYGSQAINLNSNPVIVDNAEDEEFVDPYQNSILKD